MLDDGQRQLHGGLRRRALRHQGLATAVDDLQTAVVVLDEGGEAFDPVTIVAVQHAVDLADLGVVDVAADDAARHASWPRRPRRIRSRR